MNKKVEVAWFPKTNDLAGNPYWERTQQALEELGVVFSTTHNSYWMNRTWLWSNRNHVQVLHLHFIQPFYETSNGRASLRRLLKFTSDLLLARWLGYRIVWTLHDLMPTWSKDPRWVERLARYVMAWQAHNVIVHCHEAKRALKQAFFRSRRVWILPLPSYAEAHPSAVSQSQARTQLSISHDCRVIGFIGGIRPNKGLEDLIAAFQAAQIPDSLLLIAGRPWPPQNYIDRLHQLAAANSRIVLYTEEIPDKCIQMYLKAADVMVFPFRQVLTSSSVVLAMSFARPVIVPRLGCLPELIGSDAGFIFEPANVENLALVLKEAVAADLKSMGLAAAKRANTYTWRDLALETLKVYGDR